MSLGWQIATIVSAACFPIGLILFFIYRDKKSLHERFHSIFDERIL